MSVPVFTASGLAQRFGLALRGEDREVQGVATLADAGPAQLSFLANPRYRSQLTQTRAGVVVLRAEDADAFAGGTATRADRAGETIGIIKAEIARMGAEGPTEQELAQAKSYLIGSYALRFDSSSKIARQVLGIMQEGLGIDYVEKRNEKIAAVTIEDARRVAHRLYGEGPNMVVTVGPEKTKTANAEPASAPKL